MLNIDTKKKEMDAVKYKHVIWDWNGTLLNDIELNHKLLNHLQKLKGVKLSGLSEYRDMFAFPITDLYKKAGIYEGEEDFKNLAEIYIKEYEENVGGCILQDGATNALKKLRNKNITCSILTAGPEKMVSEQLKEYKIDSFFEAVTGKRDFYASGKSELIEIHMDKINYAPCQMVFIGDTLHDKEIADTIGCDCIIVLNGHQNNEKRLEECGCSAENIEKAVEIVLNK